MTDAAVAQNADVSPEDAGRHAVYAFLSRVLYASPKADEQAVAAYFSQSDSNLGRAFASFADALSAADPRETAQEYHDLFIGVGRGELLPFGSYYLTGFLNEKPLADLRSDLSDLGFERAMGVAEPEDHVATLCDVMANLIAAPSGDATVYAQERFFSAHLKPWAGKFFVDLQAAKKADLYRSIGQIGALFMGIEEEGFSMLARA